MLAGKWSSEMFTMTEVVLLWAVLLLDTENDKQQKCGNSKFSKFWSSKNHLNFHKLSSHIKHWHFSSSWKFIKLERMILLQIYLDSWKVTSINDYKAIFRLSVWIIFLGQVFSQVLFGSNSCLPSKYLLIQSQQYMHALEKCVKYLQIEQKRHQDNINDVVLLSLLLTLNIFDFWKINP